MTEDKQRLTRTARYLTNTGKSSGFDGTVEVEGLGDPTFVPRLAWHGGAKVPASDVDLASSIANATAKGATIFADSSVFHDGTDPRLMAAMLAEPRSVVLIPEVLNELAPYVAKRPNSAIARALASPVTPFREHQWPVENERASAQNYYVGLLALRKRLVELAHVKFEREHGRLPGDADAPKIRADLQSNFGERGYLLAKKGHAAKGRINRFTDELLVYAAAEHAIISGKGVILLTGDEDLVEQMYKLMFLIDTHYRSMLIADAYMDDFGRFPPLAFPPLTGDLGDTFKDGNNALIRKSPGLEEELLPPLFTFVPLSCWVTNDYFSSLTFGAERELERVLRVKGETAGLNTARMNGRNCHFWLAPLNVDEEHRDCAVLAHDRRLRFPGTNVYAPSLDMKQALFTGERFRRLESPIASTGGLSIAESLLDL